MYPPHTRDCHTLPPHATTHRHTLPQIATFTTTHDYTSPHTTSHRHTIPPHIAAHHAPTTLYRTTNPARTTFIQTPQEKQKTKDSTQQCSTCPKYEITVEPARIGRTWHCMGEVRSEGFEPEFRTHCLRPGRGRRSCAAERGSTTSNFFRNAFIKKTQCLGGPFGPALCVPW